MSVPIKLESVVVPGVNSATCSVVRTVGIDTGVPVILVHGILDNLGRWLTPEQSRRFRLALSDARSLVPMFDLQTQAPLPRLWEGDGLLTRLGEEGVPAVAYTYQDWQTPVADMAVAVEKLHRVLAWAMQCWRASRVCLIGHSRGGLVCRHALITDSAVMSAGQFRDRVDRLITLCTPHRGSRLAEVSRPLRLAIDEARKLRDSLRDSWRIVASLDTQWLDHFGSFLSNLSELRPGSAEVRQCSVDKLPALPGGYYALAGTNPTYLPVVADLRLPPALPLPELTAGQGDMAVAVASALDIPEADAQRTVALPVNHLTAARDHRVHDAVLEWL